jgi:hypothetical protein
MRTDHFLSLISNLGNLLMLYNLLIINNLFSRKEKSIFPPEQTNSQAHQSSENLLLQQQLITISFRLRLRKTFLQETLNINQEDEDINQSATKTQISNLPLQAICSLNIDRSRDMTQ